MTEININGEKISKELLELIIKRIGAMPEGVKLAVLGEILDRDEIIKQIRGNTQIGREILMIEIGYYKDLSRDYNAQ